MRPRREDGMDKAGIARRRAESAATRSVMVFDRYSKHSRGGKTLSSSKIMRRGCTGSDNYPTFGRLVKKGKQID